MSLIVTTASSMGCVTSVSTASGLAPGKLVLTTTIGKSSAGSRSTPSLVHDTRPTTSSAPITISMNSGRLIATLVSHIGVCLLPKNACRRRALNLGRDHVAIGEVIHVAGRDQRTIVDPADDLGEVVVLQSEHNGLPMDHVIRVDREHD